MADERSEPGFGRAAGAALGATRLNRRGLLRAGLLGMSGLATAALIGCDDDDEDDAAPTAAPTAAATATTAPAAGTATPAAGTATPAAGTATPAAGTATPAARTTTPTATPAARARPSSPAELDFVMNNRDPGVPPKYGGVRHTSERRRFPSVDPRVNAASDVALFHGLVSSKLLEHDGSPAIGAFEDPVVGDIAESWESSPDALAFTFQLNPKAQWHNRAPADGRQVVAEDVKFTYELWMAGTLTAGRFAAVDSVEVVDEGTVRIALKGPTPELLDTFAFEHHPIVNPEFVDARGGEIGDGADWVGSGPFILTGWEPGVLVEFERNPNYHGVDEFGNQLPYVDSMQRITIRERAAQIAAFVAGELEQVGIPIEDFDEWASRDDVKLGRSSVAAGQLLLTPNMREQPFDDLRVRRAISMSIDRLAVWRDITSELAGRSGPIPPLALGRATLPSWDDLPPNYQFNPAEAKKLLDAAGLADGLDLGPLSYWSITPEYNNSVLVFAQQLQDAGFSVTPNLIERTPFLEQRTTGTWEGLQYQTQSTPGGTMQAWAEWMHSEGGSNFWGIANPDVDQAVEQLRVTLDPNERQELFQRLEELEYENVFRAYTNGLTSVNASKSNLMNAYGSGFLFFKSYTHKYEWFDN